MTTFRCDGKRQTTQYNRPQPERIILVREHLSLQMVGSIHNIIDNEIVVVVFVVAGVFPLVISLAYFSNHSNFSF